MAVHLGNKEIFYPSSPLTLQVTVNSCNATQTILNPSVPDIRNFSNSSHPLFVIVATHLSLAVCPGSWTSDLLHRHTRMNMHARCERVGALTNWASQTDNYSDFNQSIITVVLIVKYAYIVLTFIRPTCTITYWTATYRTFIQWNVLGRLQ